MSKLTSVRLSDELVQRLDEIAAFLDRPRAWLIEQAITRYVDEDARQVAAISEALAEYRQGGAMLTPHTQVIQALHEQIRTRTGDADPLA